MTKKITVASNYNDWEGVYVNGKLIQEHHHIDWPALLKHLGFEYESLEITDQEWLENLGSLPEKLEDIPKTALATEEDEDEE